MSRNKSVIKLKLKRLKKEYAKEKPDKNIIRRLEASIRRHKQINRIVGRATRISRYKRKRGRK